MPRLNVYLPADLYEKAAKWRSSVNLSDICARAIRDEVAAMESHRWLGSLTKILKPTTGLERALVRHYGLTDAVVGLPEDEAIDQRELLGQTAAAYLDRMVTDGVLIAVAGGRQMWCVMQHLSPRRVGATITALGLHHADPGVLHVHPNTLTTLLWLLYAPRSSAHVIGAAGFTNVWSAPLPAAAYPKYFVVSSCGTFEPASPVTKLLDPASVSHLLSRNVVGDYAYIFFDPEGLPISLKIDAPQSLFTAKFLCSLSRRDDARTILVAGGHSKVNMIDFTLKSGVCNTLITDVDTAHCLLNSKGNVNE